MLLAASGCTLGPKQIDHSRLRYNEAIQRTLQEEMLLNIVRLKYREIPEFVSVNGVAAQYTFQGGAGIDGTLLEGGPNVLGLDAAVTRAERPTISYAPMRSREFHEGLLGPIDIQTLMLVGRTGWSWDRILRMSVQHMNGVDNATSAGGPTPDFKPNYEEFKYLAHLFRQLQLSRGVELAFAERSFERPLPVKPHQVDGNLVSGVLSQGFRFKTSDPEAHSVVLEKDEEYTTLVFRPTSWDSHELHEIQRLLRLDPERHRYELFSAREGQKEESQDDDPTIRRLPPLAQDHVTVGTRSLLEVMFYLSQGICIPYEHYEQGLVTVTLDEFGEPFDWSEMNGDLFNVYCCEHKPANAAVAVQFKGYWFYIDDSDLNSQSTFILLVELFGIEVRGGGGGSGIFYSLNVGG